MPKTSAPAPSFEEAMSSLETLVSQLERGDLPLEQSLAAFEKGAGLVKVCQDHLKTAQLRVEKIMVQTNTEGAPSITGTETF